MPGAFAAVVRPGLLAIGEAKKENVFQRVPLVLSLTLAGSIASVEVITKIILYYLDERAWGLVPWGRRRVDALATRPAQTEAATP